MTDIVGHETGQDLDHLAQMTEKLLDPDHEVDRDHPRDTGQDPGHEAGHDRTPGKTDPGHPTGGGDTTGLDHKADREGQDELRGYREVKERQW